MIKFGIHVYLKRSRTEVSIFHQGIVWTLCIWTNPFACKKSAFQSLHDPKAVCPCLNFLVNIKRDNISHCAIWMLHRPSESGSPIELRHCWRLWPPPANVSAASRFDPLLRHFWVSSALNLYLEKIPVANNFIKN